jgi:hypothetical protein
VQDRSMRMGRVLGLVAAALVLFIGGLVIAVYLTRDEDNIQVDNVLSENISKAIAQSEDPDVGTGGRVDLRRVADFDWDRVLVVAPGVSRARISKELGREWTGVAGVDYGELLIFRRGNDIARFANYRGTGRFEGFEPLQEIARDKAVFQVRQLVISEAG